MKTKRTHRNTFFYGAMLIVLVIASASPAHETDQYTTPVGRTFADLGPYFSRWAYGAIERGCDKLNDRIRAHMKATGDKQGQDKDYDTQTVADAVNASYPWAMGVIEGLEEQVKSLETWRQYPGQVAGYKRMFDNALQKIHMPVDPRQFFRIWLGSTLKVYGHYIGTDKIGHFTDMGKNYFNDYQAAKRKGGDQAICQKAALDVGREGLIFSETGVLGYLSAGAYSNGDMISNYMGMLFYMNLTQPVKLKGQTRPPLLVRDGPFWKPAPHVRPDSDFMKWFFSDHWDEAMNPSHYETGMRKAVRKAVHERSTGILERYRDVNGCRRSRQWFEDKTLSLKKYYDTDYAHRGDMENRIVLSRTCYVHLPADSPQDQRDHLGFNRLHQAAMNGQVDVVKTLLQAGWKADTPVRSGEIYSSDWGNTPLHLAARGGHLEVAEALLAAGADVNCANDVGATPLHYATRDVLVVQALLDAGAKVDATDVRSRTPLHWAVAYHADEVVAALLGKGASVDAVDRDGRTPLHRAAQFGDVAAIERLIQRGAKVNAMDRIGRTPLHIAAGHHQPAAVQALIEHKADVSAVDKFGGAPLHCAARSGGVEGVEESASLVGAGASVNATDKQDTTPLHVAAREGNVTMVQWLLSKGARTGAVNKFGSTPLHEAAASGCQWTTGALLDAGANVKTKNSRGQTAKAIAKAGKHRAVEAAIDRHAG